MHVVPEEKQPGVPGRRAALWALGLLTLGGLALRLFRLTAMPLWNDESLQYSGLTLPFTALRAQHLLGVDHFPPLSYWIQRLFWLPGQSLFAAKLAGVLAGTLMIPAAYYFGARHADRAAGLWAAFFTSTSFFLVYYAQDLRAYAFQGLFLFLFLGLWCELLFAAPGRAGNRLAWLLFFATGLLCGLTHYATLVLLPTLGLATLGALGPDLILRPAARHARLMRLIQFGLVLLALLGLCYLAMRYYMGAKFTAVVGAERAAARSLSGTEFCRLLLRYSWGRGLRLLPWLALLAAATLPAGRARRNVTGPAALLLVLTFVLGNWVYPFVGMRRLDTEQSARHLFWAAWCLVMLLSAGAWALQRAARGRRARIVTVAGLAGTVLVLQGALFSHYYRMDCKRLAVDAPKKIVEALGAPRLLVLANTYDRINLQFYWPTNATAAAAPMYEADTYGPLRIPDWLTDVARLYPDVVLKTSVYHPLEPDLETTIEGLFAHKVALRGNRHAFALQALGVKPLDGPTEYLYYNEAQDWTARAAREQAPMALFPGRAPLVSTRNAQGQYAHWRLISEPGELTVIDPATARRSVNLRLPAAQLGQAAELWMSVNGAAMKGYPVAAQPSRFFDPQTRRWGQAALTVEDLLAVGGQVPLELAVAPLTVAAELRPGANAIQLFPRKAAVLLAPATIP